MEKNINNSFPNDTLNNIVGRLFLADPCVCASLSFVYTRETDDGKEIWFNDWFRILWDIGETAQWDIEDNV